MGDGCGILRSELVLRMLLLRFWYWVLPGLFLDRESDLWGEYWIDPLW